MEYTYDILSLLFLGGNFLIALLAYIDRHNKRKYINLPCNLSRIEVGLFLTYLREANHFVGGCSFSII